jgi:PAS domain-containing protein
LQATVRDITEKKKAEMDLSIFKSATESSLDAIGMYTLEGKHYYQNKAFDEMFGDIGNDPPGSIYVDEKVGREVFQTIMAGNKWSGEVEMYGKGKKLLNIQLRAFPVKDNNGKTVGLMGIHTDITERKQAKDKF